MKTGTDMKRYPSTNSLGSAKVDCNTCGELGQTCDRQRPRCGPCLRSRRQCGGYPIDLKWSDARMVQPSKRRTSRQGQLDETRSLRFVGTAPKRRKKRRLLADDAEKLMTTFRAVSQQQEPDDAGMTHMGDGSHKPSVPTFGDETEINSARLDLSDSRHAMAYTTTQALEDNWTGATGRDDHSRTRRHTSTEGSLRAPSSDDFDMAGESSIGGEEDQIDYGSGDDVFDSTWYRPAITDTNTIEQQDSYAEGSTAASYNLALARYVQRPEDVQYDNESGSAEDSPTYSSSSDESPFHRFPLSPIVKYGSFANKVAAVLDMYDQEFCILPLSEDVRSNPFRVRRDTCEGSAFLLHAVLALASQHLAKKNKSAEMITQMHNHQATAVKLFSEAVAYTPAFTALDTLLLLVNFEATQTASSTWGVHLGGAFNIIEGIGIDVVCQRSSRTRAQIAMLVWWDVTIALISRKAPRFPARYLETLLHYSGEDGWSWISLNGCPVELVTFMSRLSRLAAIYEKVLDMEWTSFDHTPVRQIISEVREWKNPEAMDDVFDDLSSPRPPSRHAEHHHEGSGSSTGEDEDPNIRLNRSHCIEAWREAILLYAFRIFFRSKQKTPLESFNKYVNASDKTQQELEIQQRRKRQITLFSRRVLDHVRCIPSTAIVQKQTLLPVFLAAAEISTSTSDFEATRDFVRTYCHHWSLTARYDMFTTVGTLLERVWADSDLAKATAPENEEVEGGRGQDYWWGCTVGQADFRSPSATSASAFADDDAADSGLLVSELLLG